MEESNAEHFIKSSSQMNDSKKKLPLYHTRFRQQVNETFAQLIEQIRGLKYAPVCQLPENTAAVETTIHQLYYYWNDCDLVDLTTKPKDGEPSPIDFSWRR